MSITSLKLIRRIDSSDLSTKPNLRGLKVSSAGHDLLAAFVKLTFSSQATISDSLQRFGLPGMVGLGKGQEKHAGMRSGVLQK